MFELGGNPTKSRYVVISFAGALLGTIPIFAALLSSSGVSAEVQVAWRLAVGTPILIIAALLVETRKEGRPVSGKDIRSRDLFQFLGIGGTLMGSFLMYVESISVGTPVATAVLLFYSQPVFSMVLSRIALGERITGARLVALFLGVSGVLVVYVPQGFGHGVGPGEALALAAGFLFSVYLISSKEMMKRRDLHPVTMASLSFAGALLLLLPVGLLVQFLLPSSVAFEGFLRVDLAQAGLLLGLIALGTVIPYLVLNLGLKETLASETGITLLVEPVSATALGYLILGQRLGLSQGIGGLLIIAGIVVLSFQSRLSLRFGVRRGPSL